MWKTHFIICTVLALATIPVYFLESMLVKKGEGGFIMVDLTGIIVVPYILFAITHILLSTGAVKIFSSAGLLPVHVTSGAASIAIVAIGFFIYINADERKQARDQVQNLERIRKEKKVIRIKAWWYVPNMDSATEIHAQLYFAEGGRYAGSLSAYGEGEYGEQLFSSDDVPQRMVSAGDEFEEVYPLKISQRGKVGSISFMLSLFKAEQGPAEGDVTIIFTNNPKQEYDGHFIYNQLPPPRKPE